MGCCNTPSTCIREHISAALIRPLRYVRGVDAEGCVSYADASTLAITVADTNTLDLTLAAGTLSGQVRISASPNNILTALGDGLFVPRAPVQGVNNSQTLTLTLSSAGILSGAVNVSSNAGNQLQVLANGLFVPAPPSPFISAIADTNTIDLNVSGGTLTAQAIISPNPGNQLQALGNGLFVPPSGSAITVSDTPTVDLTLSGGNLTANVIVSPNTGNQLQALSNGLFVPPSAAGITVSDTPTVDLTLSGGNLTADVIVSPNAGNQLQALGNGLFVPPYTLRDCANNPLNNGDRVVRCVTSNPVNLQINNPFVGTSPNTAYQIASVACNSGQITHDLGVIGNNIVAIARDNQTKYLGILASMPTDNRSVSITNPSTQITIDQVQITNPSNCRFMLVFVRMGNVILSVSSTDTTITAIGRVALGIVDTLFGTGVVNGIAEIGIAPGTPGLTNTPITNENWYTNRESGPRWGISLIPPGATHTFSRVLTGTLINSTNSSRWYGIAQSNVTFYGLLIGEY